MNENRNLKPLLLRPLRKEDEKAFLEYRKKTPSLAALGPEEEFRHLLEKVSADPGSVTGVFQRGRLVGLLFLTRRSEKEAEIGYEVAKDQRGKGIGGAMLLSFLPQALLRYPVLIARVEEGNLPSRSLLRKAGFLLLPERIEPLSTGGSVLLYEKRRFPREE